MTWLSEASVEHVLGTYGPWAVFVIVTLESAGLPLPAESLLVAAAAFAATTHGMSLPEVMVAASAGAIVGDNLGYWIGRKVGRPLIARYGQRIGLTPQRLRLGEYLFARRGGTIVIVARFIVFLRTLAALLAGANAMPWLRFLVCNAAGGILWAVAYSAGGYVLGAEIRRLTLPLALAGVALGLGLVLAMGFWLKRAEARLQAEADRAGREA
jgi:membrane protein DedA with SNARE-associated domain